MLVSNYIFSDSNGLCVIIMTVISPLGWLELKHPPFYVIYYMEFCNMSLS